MLWPGFELRVALRFLREGRMQTVLIIVGVAAGVAVIAYISALISGLQNSTLTKTLGAQAHISVRAPDDGVTPAAAPSPGANVLTETQPRAQRPRSVANWQAHNAALKSRTSWLNKHNFQSLHFTGPGTDLTIGLADGHEWKGGASLAKNGVTCNPNIPKMEHMGQSLC